MRIQILLSVILVWTACGPNGSSAPEEQTRNLPQAIQGGSDDDGTPLADVVVRLAGTNARMCTGTLITPTAVLTAKHCIMGDSDGNPPLGFPIRIQVGNRLGVPWVRIYNSNRADVIGARQTFTVGMVGADIAIVWIDPPQYAFDYADIRRPTLASPCALGEPCPDANGGRYAYPFGMAGWSPVDTSDYRKVAFQDLFHHYPGYPDSNPAGQYWEREQNLVATHPGDSGSPLFNTAGGYRDVMGVLSGTRTTYRFPFESVTSDEWTDITRGEPAAWLRQEMTDLTHTARWNSQHPGHIWLGEFDYTGSCQPSRDADCDHWYNEHDNCPGIFNPDQVDTLDNGVGDACRLIPTLPPDCLVTGGIDAVSFYCREYPVPPFTNPAEVPSLQIQRNASGSWISVPSSPDHPRPLGVEYTYRVRYSNRNGDGPWATYRATPADYPSCESICFGQCGILPRGGGLSCDCGRCEDLCPVCLPPAHAQFGPDGTCSCVLD